MIMYIRCDGDVDNVFQDLVELTEGTDARSIYEALRESLRVSSV